MRELTKAFRTNDSVSLGDNSTAGCDFQPRTRRLFWGITLGWASLIFYLSTAGFGPNSSERVLTRLISLLCLNISPNNVHTLQAILRKSGHLGEYAILALLLYLVLSSQTPFLWNFRRVLLCLFIAVAYSFTDEFHQCFVPTRHPSLFDCGVDCLGAAVALGLLYPSQKWLKRQVTRASPVKGSTNDL